jgi:hypothetical protein
MQKRIVLVIVSVLALAGTIYFWTKDNITSAEAELTPVPSQVLPTMNPAHAPDVIPIINSGLRTPIVEAGDYLVRQQLANGELPYQVNFLNNDRSSTPTYIRLMGGTGALYTVCRVAGDDSYCEAGDRALAHYSQMLLTDPERFKGTCLYTNGACPLGGASVTVDAIYKRWQATGTVMLGDQNLLSTAADLGYFIASMRRPDGGFYHTFDPHIFGTVDPNYVSPTFNGESLVALLQLYEMTDNDFWLTQARDVNKYMLSQPVTEDYAHGYAFALFARLDNLTQAEQVYAKQIADLIIAGEVRSLNPVNSSIATSTKLEALAALAQAFVLSDTDHIWLDREIRPFVTFVSARQLPDDDCNLTITSDIAQRYKGGVFNTCDDLSIRVDGVQHWVNGLTAYLEYQSLAGKK